jgi:LmbE family N-acetylglucosaminyl deacetylase
MAEQDPSSAGPVLAVFAHPDDAEISSGGTLAKWAASGRDVHLLVLTNGDRGSNDRDEDREALARTRAEESEAAGRVLGLSSVRILDTPDGELENTPGVRAAVARRIREVRPAVVVSSDPTTWFMGNRYINHSDHRTAGVVTVDAVFPGAGNPLFFAEQLAEGLEPWDTPEVWLGWSTSPNHDEDITGFLDTKIAALEAHVSQVKGDMLGFFKEWLPAEAEENGRRLGVTHAESFRRMTLT